MHVRGTTGAYRLIQRCPALPHPGLHRPLLTFQSLVHPATLPALPSAAAQRTCLPRPVLQPQLLYPRAFYLYLMASNFFLRLAWTHKLSPHLRKHQLAAFLFVVGEVFRCAALA